MNPHIKRKLRQILPIGVIWLVIGMLILWTEYVSIEEVGNTPSSAIKLSLPVAIFALVAVFIVGIVVGFLEYTLLKKWFDGHSFLQKICFKLLIYFCCMSVIILITFCITVSLEIGVSVFDAQVWERYGLFFWSITHLSTAIQISFSLLVSLLYIELSAHLGHNVMLNFWLGKYHQPVEEVRIFMFTDMKSSTQIAENLGHVRYFDFLKDYYNSLSQAIITHEGEVYQYIGDEIVLTWKVSAKGNTQQALACFYAMKAALRKKHPFFLQKFGFSPDFKAAIHVGKVTTGQIGALKKEVFFTGDVLNTTARIQALCNPKKLDLLFSASYAHLLKRNHGTTSIGYTTLQGKTQKLELFTVKDEL